MHLANFKMCAMHNFKVKLFDANMLSAKFSLWLLWIRDRAQRARVSERDSAQRRSNLNFCNLCQPIRNLQNPCFEYSCDQTLCSDRHLERSGERKKSLYFIKCNKMIERMGTIEKIVCVRKKAHIFNSFNSLARGERVSLWFDYI